MEVGGKVCGLERAILGLFFVRPLPSSNDLTLLTAACSCAIIWWWGEGRERNICLFLAAM